MVNEKEISEALSLVKRLFEREIGFSALWDSPWLGVIGTLDRAYRAEKKRADKATKSEISLTLSLHGALKKVESAEKLNIAFSLALKEMREALHGINMESSECDGSMNTIWRESEDAIARTKDPAALLEAHELATERKVLSDHANRNGCESALAESVAVDDLPKADD